MSGSTGLFIGSPTSPEISSFAESSLTHHPSAASSHKPGSFTPSELGDDVSPIDHEEITRLMNGTLRDFLVQHTYPGGAVRDMEFIRMRGVERDLRRLGFFLDEQLPDPKQTARCDLSTLVWLQIAEEVGDRLIVLNLDEFNNLVARVLAKQYGSLSSVLQLKHISADKLKEVAHMIVRDPTGVFRPMVQQ